MECFWRLLGDWKPDGHCYQQDPAVFYVYFYPHDGITDHIIHGACFLEKYEEVYDGRPKKSLVLPLSLL
jgi:hypothetical protein